MAEAKSYDADLSTTGEKFRLGVMSADKAYIRYRKTEDGSGGAAVAEVREMISDKDTPRVPASTTAIALDGTVTEVDVSEMAFLVGYVTTARTGEAGVFHVYTRENAE